MVITIAVLICVSVPVYAFIRMVQSFTSKKRSQEANGGTVRTKVFDACCSMAIFFLLMIGFLINKSGVAGGEPIGIFALGGAKVNGYASLANEHVLSVIILLIIGMFSFWMVGSREALSPILFVAGSTVLILNILFAIIYLTHTAFTHDGEDFSVLILQFSFLSLIFLYIARLKESLNSFVEKMSETEINYNHPFLLFLYRTSSNYQKMSQVWVIFLFPVLILIQMLLVLFGQRPDSFIRVFLDTSSFHYSRIPAPPPEVIEGDGHYLCTVSATGHRKLVKPIRAGIRRGSRIVVNRQLLIANAFENILEKYTPNCHKSIRKFYDKYGYPVSRHIQSKWSADLVYLMMKPLEWWFFLIVLYTVDQKPENRIHIQYSELRK
ncbi:DUF6688 domain-containing protein [Neobacillus terrae]|uniref:DUF6688 domain-containing protein n=1 Tax=Neobacillus terrae TaxID=3034837 RepID=UPI00140E8DFA|nr:DUF6688 family protein [Neobacillus terrae]NHM32030.1 hypothetical protein [Neobacillus terrae]